ncbi:hypothetical protein [Syntrophomonas wolfei]|uniref:hypothetical protein n=1 Tax=Syntrophomonas wolfei TaxID=863 RepID=UPI0007744232|nr:hypothetical protein [Syntrophomonas wolfei]
MRKRKPSAEQMIDVFDASFTKRFLFNSNLDAKEHTKLVKYALNYMKNEALILHYNNIKNNYFISINRSLCLLDAEFNALKTTMDYDQIYEIINMFMDDFAKLWHRTSSADIEIIVLG